MLFDSHAHYDNQRFDEDRFETIKKAYDSGVTYILNAAADMASSVETISLTREFEFVYGAVGVHPHAVSEMNDNDIATLANFTMEDKIVAIGEIGLDYYYDYSPREQQKLWFAKQISLARKLNLPIIVHDRDAHKDVLDIIKSEQAKDVGGVFHCYSGSVEMLRDVLENNFCISVGGALTFKNAKKTVEVVEHVPLDKLLIETDCPYLTPEPHRGKRNDSSYVRLVAEKIAKIKGISFEEVAEATMNNSKRLFNIK
ncbi:TatD family hydrolase [Acetivibrio mesophilus]|uniref:TatD family deoxyribonuclease n=1 Tax=Acetivibrio mesophilus TaxID=2487273 RepID=A0A4Q0I4R4_9FIRM|nr:TatD family hydrolase [Acetivibrio mesophilus]RXE59303.1 TatD family deoxyribonuclease [Acetivibrio mesophilus]